MSGHVAAGGESARQQRVAVVSGVSSRIGAAVAEAFLDRGYAVLGLSRQGNPRLADRKDYIDILADLRSASRTSLGGSG